MDNSFLMIIVIGPLRLPLWESAIKLGDNCYSYYSAGRTANAPPEFLSQQLTFDLRSSLLTLGNAYASLSLLSLNRSLIF